MSLALARKYRPRRFSAVAVQSHVSNTLRGAIARDRVAHGYLLCGPRGTGKTTLARVLAMALNCERRHEPGRTDDGEPCGECDSCRRIWSGAASLDVVEIDAASNRGVDDARELRERAMYAPSGEQRYKVYIVDEAHMLTREAWNALLKVLEEPPPRVVFVFATTEPQKIAQTAAPVLSRLQRFDLKRIGPAEIRQRLAEVLAAEEVPAEPEALAMIARAADGGLRDALSLTDQVLSLGADGGVTADGVREALGLVAEDEYLAILDLIAEHRAGDVFGAVQRLADAGVDLGAFLTGLADILRAQLAVTLGADAVEASDRLVEALRERRDRLSAGDLLRMLHLLAELEPRFRKSAQQQLLLETLLVRLALMDRSVSIEAMLRGLGGDEGDAGGGRGVARDRAPRPDGGGGGAAPGRSDRRSAPEARAQPATATLPASSGPKARDEGLPAKTSAKAADDSLSAAVAPRARLELNRVVERWDEVPALLRESGRPVLAPVVEASLPCAVTAAGVVTLQAADENTAYTLESGRDAIETALRQLFDGVQRVAVKRPAAAPSIPAQRLTLEQVREERIARMRARDPVLSAAVEALDLELID